MAWETINTCDACGRQIDEETVEISVSGGSVSFQYSTYELHESCTGPLLTKFERGILPEARKYSK